MPYKLLELLVKKITRGKATLVTVDGATEFDLPRELLPSEITVAEKLNLGIAEETRSRDDLARELLEQIIN